MTPRKKRSKPGRESGPSKKTQKRGQTKPREKSRGSSSSSENKPQRSTEGKSEKPATTQRDSKNAREKSTRKSTGRKSVSQKQTGATRSSEPYRGSRRAEAAKSGWQTRRANAERRQRQTFKANDDEPEAGDFAYALYDKAHPVNGEHETIEEWHGRLKRYYGKKIRITVNGFRANPDDEEDRHRIFIRRVGVVRGYADVFGPGSLFARALRVVRNIASQAELVVSSVTFELADESDEDEED